MRIGFTTVTLSNNRAKCCNFKSTYTGGWTNGVPDDFDAYRRAAYSGYNCNESPKEDLDKKPEENHSESSSNKQQQNPSNQGYTGGWTNGVPDDFDAYRRAALAGYHN